MFHYICSYYIYKLVYIGSFYIPEKRGGVAQCPVRTKRVPKAVVAKMEVVVATKVIAEAAVEEIADPEEPEGDKKAEARRGIVKPVTGTMRLQYDDTD